MKYLLFFTVILLTLAPSCQESKRSAKKNFWENPAQTDLDDIVKRGTLRAIVDNSSTSYYIYRGKRMGYEFEMLRSLSQKLGVQLKLVVTDDIEKAFKLLNQGKADVIAMNLEMSEERRKYASFTDATNNLSTVLVQRLDGDLLDELSELDGEEIFIRSRSIYKEQLETLRDSLSLDLKIVEVLESSESLVDKVMSQEIDYTIVDNDIALVNATYYDNINVSLEISQPSEVGWAVRKTSPQLLEQINHWIDKGKSTSYFAILYSKYFLNKKNSYFRNTSAFSSISGDRISIFDEIIKNGANELGWDWRLLAALIYKESRFDTSAVSYAGAQGLLQLMPVTLQRFGVEDATDPVESLMAGVRFLKYLDKFWRERVPDSNERIRFVLASYNVGHGHVQDAWRLALKFGKDPQRWANVAYYLEKKNQKEFYNDPIVKSGYARGHVAVAYVREVLSLYESYRVLVTP